MRKLYMMKTSRLRRLLGSVFAVVVLLAVGTGSAQAQNHQVSGTVTDSSGAPIAGATVVVKGNASRGTITGADGAYSINATSGSDVLIFSHIGYQTQEIPINGLSIVDAKFGENFTVVDEVVVVGYGTQKRQFLVGSVSQVSGKELNMTPASNVSSLAKGRLPGITSIQRSGQPGADQAQTLVRGYSTFKGSNNSSPLILVDGVERDWNMVNPNDVETISVLKDAATAAIYGVRGANGVILVTTKSGSEGEATITYNGSAIFTTNTIMPELLNAQDYMSWHNLAREMDGIAPLWTEANIQRMKEAGIYGETDWLDLLFKPYGFKHQHNISVTGGTEKVKYYASAGYENQNGIIPNNTYNRINVRSKVDVKIAKNLNLSINLGGWQSKRHQPGMGGYNIGVQTEFNPISAAIFSLPNIASTYTEDETGNVYDLATKANAYVRNPIAYLNDSGYTDSRTWKFEGSANLEYDFGSIKALKGLKAGIFTAYDFSTTGLYTYGRWFEMYAFEPLRLSEDAGPLVSKVGAVGINEINSYEKYASYSDHFVVRPTITYNREFGRHSVGALLIYEQQQNYSNSMTGRKNGYFADYPVDLNLGSTDAPIPVQGSFDNTALQSFAGRLNYAFDRKYLAEVSFRADASYLFHPKHRWGYFPSVALGWVLSEENFLKDAETPINYLKLKASYGELGNDDTQGLKWLYMMSYTSTSPNYSNILNGQGTTAYYSTNYPFEYLTWSRTRNYDLGFEAELWQGKFGIEFSWFYKYTSHILEQQNRGFAPSLGGNFPARDNTGRMDNRGFELVLRHNNRFANGWAYSLRGSLAWARNKVLSTQMSDDHSVLYQRIIGQPMGEIYGLKATGLYQTQEQIDNSPIGPRGPKRMGDIMYADINGDGIVSADDPNVRYMDDVKIGNSDTPEMNFSLDMSVSWKGIYLEALWQGVAITSYALAGRYGSGISAVPDATMYTRPFYSQGNAPYYLVENSWREDNRDALYPRLSANVNHSNNAWPSSWWVKNGAYLRLRSLTLGYDLPERFLQNSGVGGVRISVSGLNLLTFSAFKYVDPETPSVQNGYYPQQKEYSVNVALTF